MGYAPRFCEFFFLFGHQHRLLSFGYHGSSVAQWKRAGPITQRSMDRNHPLLHFFFLLFFFVQGFLRTFYPLLPCSLDSSVGRAEDCSRLCRDPYVAGSNPARGTTFFVQCPLPIV